MCESIVKIEEMSLIIVFLLQSCTSCAIFSSIGATKNLFKRHLIANTKCILY